MVFCDLCLLIQTTYAYQPSHFAQHYAWSRNNQLKLDQFPPPSIPPLSSIYWSLYGRYVLHMGRIGHPRGNWSSAGSGWGGRWPRPRVQGDDRCNRHPTTSQYQSTECLRKDQRRTCWSVERRQYVCVLFVSNVRHKRWCWISKQRTFFK